MSELLQSGLHPDAEVLSAFAEGVLPAHEHAQALAHMAECADCRQIVFLALPPAATEVSAESIWQRWLRSSPLFGIGIGAAVLAGALIFALMLRTHPASAPAPQAANAHPPLLSSTPLPQSEHAAPTVAAQPKPLRAQPPVLKVAKPSPQLKPNPQPPTLNGNGSNWITAREEPGSVGGANSGVGMGSGSGTGVAGAVMPARPSAPPPVGAADAAPRSANETFAVESQSQALHAESAQMASAEPLRAMAKMLSVQPALQSLPSKLPAAAVVSSGTRTLAVDSAGALFLSQDKGQHWLRVAAKWKGKVAQLRLAPSAAMQLRGVEQPMASDEARASAAADTGTDSISAPAAAPAPAKAPSPVAAFQLVTDSGTVWVSSDGLSWHPAP
jgi:hypothetical protein